MGAPAPQKFDTRGLSPPKFETQQSAHGAPRRTRSFASLGSRPPLHARTNYIERSRVGYVKWGSLTLAPISARSRACVYTGCAESD